VKRISAALLARRASLVILPRPYVCKARHAGMLALRGGGVVHYRQDAAAAVKPHEERSMSYTLYYSRAAASMAVHWMLIELGVPSIGVW